MCAGFINYAVSLQSPLNDILPLNAINRCSDLEVATLRVELRVALRLLPGPCYLVQTIAPPLLLRVAAVT